MSLRDRILSSKDIKSSVVHVEAWDTDLDIRTLTALERSRLISQCTKSDGNIDLEKMYPLLIIAGVYDPESGEKVFTAEDITLLQDKSAQAIEFVAQEVMRVSGMDNKAVDEEGKSN